MLHVRFKIPLYFCSFMQDYVYKLINLYLGLTPKFMLHVYFYFIIANLLFNQIFNHTAKRSYLSITYQL